MTKNETKPLDTRIADALATKEELAANVLLALCNEVGGAAGVAERTARDCRARSIDPLVRDAVAERSKAEDQEFIASRLRAAATPLHEKYQRAVRRDELAAWEREAADVRSGVTRIAEELKEVYERCSSELVAMFKRARMADAEVDRVNSHAPAGSQVLCKVEATARNIPALHPSDTSVIDKCVLPPLVFDHTIGTVVNIWPPAPINAGLAYAMDVARMCGVVSSSSWDDGSWEFVFIESLGHYDWRRKAGAPPPPIQGGPEPMRPGETPYQYGLRMQQKNAEASARHIRIGEEMEREHQRLNAEAHARAELAAAERRRVEAGG